MIEYDMKPDYRSICRTSVYCTWQTGDVLTNVTMKSAFQSLDKRHHTPVTLVDHTSYTYQSQGYVVPYDVLEFSTW